MKKFTILMMVLLMSIFMFGQDPAIHVTNDGNVAIGSWSASSKLHVTGGGILTDSYFGLHGGNFTIPTSGSFMAVENTRGNLVFYQNGEPRLTIGSFGNESLIGIGNGSSQQDFPLYIKGQRDSGNPMLKLESTSNQSLIQYKTADGSGGWEGQWYTGINGPYPGRFYFQGSGYGPTVFFDWEGYNGFGIANPEATIHIRQWVWGAKDGFRITNASSVLNIYGKPGGDFHIDSNTPLILNQDGNYVGIGSETIPSFPLHMASGACVTVGGVWTNASSRDLKENIQDLTVEEALEALYELSPKKYNYKTEKDEEYLGFIAEDVPDLVATKDRKSMSSMDVVALLTKIVQDQQKKIEELESRIQ
ncbi:MAG: hypothetical protein CL661_11795 [Bacteroidetes bacterium]|nr:hypothetical protein [Bacteroidota bacterium]MAE09424.1 hypothetical protein [Bacteroidota bacterium]|tara:strand:- start:296 stop:1381 length:1086 start_codon:yes stop_codon:yes gene_type:complete